MDNIWRNSSDTSSTDQSANNSVRNKTYNNVIETIMCVAHNHKLIKDVSSGDIWEIDLEKNALFPYFHVSPVNCKVQGNMLKFNFQCFVMDLVEPHKSNNQQVMSDTLYTLLDIIQTFKGGASLVNSQGQHYWTDEDFICEPFTEEYTNHVSGWVVNLTINIDWLACQDTIIDSNNCIQ